MAAVQTSAAQFGALGPAFQRPLIGVELRQQDVVVGDEWQQVLVDDVFICQADFCVLYLGENLQQEMNRGNSGVNFDKKRSLMGGATLLASTHHHHDAFVQWPTRLECLSLAVHGVLPLQPVLNELLRLGVFALCIQDEVSGHLVFHRCR